MIFRGNYAFLSNFAKVPVLYQGKVYPTVEHAFQAAKTLDEKERELIRSCKTPTEAKRIGRKVHLRSDWEGIKLSVMEELIRIKFQNPEFKEKLLKTGNTELVEDNTWNDTFWGVCNGIGKNYLGKILMKIREEIR